ncbi:MAG: chromosomal replication initiator protein DnaA [Sphingopyxis sp.]
MIDTDGQMMGHRAPVDDGAGLLQPTLPLAAPVDLAAIWSVVSANLRQDIGVRTFDQWLKHIKPDRFDVLTGELVLGAPSAFTGEQIEKRFGDRLRMAWSQNLPQLQGIRIVATTRGAPSVASIAPAQRGAAPIAPTGQLPLVAAPHVDPRFTFDNFVPGRSNILALNAARRMAAAPAPAFHPLYLRAETGQGKTHLLHAIVAATLARNPQARIILMSAEKFMLEFIAAMRANDMLAFKSRLRAADLLLIDDLQFIIGKDSTQIELLHTFDEVMSTGGRLVVAADRLPHRLDGVEQRLLSRLAGGLVADIDAPDLDLRAAILERKAAALGSDIPAVVLDWIAQHFTRNVRELEGALNKLIAYSALTDTPIDLASAQDRLAETVRGSRARITIKDIQRAVCAHYRLDRSEMASQRRSRAVARPRQVAMYLAKELTPRSFPEIGRRFGGRDHSTVIHAVRTIETLRADDADLDTDIRRIRQNLTA